MINREEVWHGQHNNKSPIDMTPGERCDEIVKLRDELNAMRQRAEAAEKRLDEATIALGEKIIQLSRAEKEVDRLRVSLADIRKSVCNASDTVWMTNGNITVYDFIENALEAWRGEGAVTCHGCGCLIDPDMCYCGTTREFHNAYDQGHSFVPSGCDCLRRGEGA